MRIITGRYKGRNLYTVKGRTTRPTTDYNRERVFSMYNHYEGKRVLDLFAGTGSLGLEALSRGAVWADFVEFATPALAALLRNVNLLGCGDICHVWRKRVKAFLKGTDDAWDVIFLDPPYGKGLINTTLRLIFERGLLREGGMIIAEHSPAEPVLPEFKDRINKEKGGKGKFVHPARLSRGLTLFMTLFPEPPGDQPGASICRSLLIFLHSALRGSILDRAHPIE